MHTRTVRCNDPWPPLQPLARYVDMVSGLQ